MSTGMKAEFTGWSLISFQRMLFTYSFDRARGCRSYQSSTSLSVSNTGNLRNSNKVGNSTINAQQTDFCYLMFYFSELPRLGIGEEDMRPTRMRPSSRSVQNRRKRGRMSRSTCREKVFVIYFS